MQCLQFDMPSLQVRILRSPMKRSHWLSLSLLVVFLLVPCTIYLYLILNVVVGVVKFFSYIYVSEYPAAASCRLAVPTPAVSVATTPVFDTRLVNEVVGLPYPNIALSPP